MSNKYLAKLAGVSPPASLTSKLALGTGIIGLGMSAGNLANNHQAKLLERERVRLEKKRSDLEQRQFEMDQKSLRALGSIHKALVNNVKTN